MNCSCYKNVSVKNKIPKCSVYISAVKTNIENILSHRYFDTNISERYSTIFFSTKSYKKNHLKNMCLSFDSSAAKLLDKCNSIVRTTLYITSINYFLMPSTTLLFKEGWEKMHGYYSHVSTKWRIITVNNLSQVTYRASQIWCSPLESGKL